jgi:XTP/dITP diphosphohydrolase
MSFVENALAKARHASRRARLPAFADDSGICVASLDGEPGVHSARFAGHPEPSLGRDAQDARNNRKLIELLADKDDRRAHYHCVIVLMRHASDPEPIIAEGSWAGEIVAEPRGSNGFGYDPHFYLRDLGKTAAELDPEQKNLVSHRGKALRRLLAKLKEGV